MFGTGSASELPQFGKSESGKWGIKDADGAVSEFGGGGGDIVIGQLIGYFYRASNENACQKNIINFSPQTTQDVTIYIVAEPMLQTSMNPVSDDIKNNIQGIEIKTAQLVVSFAHGYGSKSLYIVTGTVTRGTSVMFNYVPGNKAWNAWAAGFVVTGDPVVLLPE